MKTIYLLALVLISTTVACDSRSEKSSHEENPGHRQAVTGLGKAIEKAKETAQKAEDASDEELAEGDEE